MKSRYTIEFPSLLRVFGYRLPPHIVEVNSRLPLALKQSVELCAKYFMHEGYSGFIHYDCTEGDDTVAFLLTNGEMHHAIGACCFRKRDYSNMPCPFWTMHWAWIHPYERNKGLLSDYVETFHSRFGYWFPEAPHSKAMTRFIEKHGLIEPKQYFNL